MSEEITDIQQDANPVEQSTVNPISEGITASNDADDDAVLESIMGSDEPEVSVAEAEDAGAAVPEPEVAATTEEVQADAETTSEPGEDYHRAMAALQRDGTPREVLDYMYEQNPDDFTKWGLKREKVQRDGDRFGDEYSKLKEQLESIQSGESQPTNTDNPVEEPSHANVSESNPSSVASKSMEKSMTDISEIFGQEAAQAIMSPIQSLTQALAGAYQQIQRLTGYAESKEMDVARASLKERFPQLDTEEAYGQVVEKMKTLHKSGDYQSIQNLMTDAARIVYAETAPPKDNTPVNKAKSLGQPTVTTKTKTGKKSLDHESREDAALDAILNGGGLDGAIDAYSL